MSKLVVNQQKRKRQNLSKLSPSKVDPTRTTALRERFTREIIARLRLLKKRIYGLLVEEDALGLLRKNNNPFVNNSTNGVENTRWIFQTDSQKRRDFEQWIEAQIRDIFFTGTTEELVQRYIFEGFTRGAGRSFQQVKESEYGQSVFGEQLDFYEGTREDFLRSAFGLPVHRDKVNLVADRTMMDLRSMTTQTASALNRILVDGLIEGDNPYKIARTINDSIDSIGVKRARTIARTEIIRAHAEGQLIALDRLGITEFGVSVEWKTSGLGTTKLGNPSPCKLCKPLEGIVLTREEASGLIPRHPNCMCMFIPANVGEDTKTKWSKSKIEERIRESVSKEKRSRWIGADRKIEKERPKSILENKRNGIITSKEILLLQEYLKCN